MTGTIKRLWKAAGSKNLEIFSTTAFTYEKIFLMYFLKFKRLGWSHRSLSKGLLIWGETSHLSGIFHMSEIPAEWCISLCKNKSFIWEWYIPPRWHPTATQVRSHLGGMVFIHVISFCRAVPPRQDCSFSLDSVCFYSYYVQKCNLFYKI